MMALRSAKSLLHEIYRQLDVRERLRPPRQRFWLYPLGGVGILAAITGLWLTLVVFAPGPHHTPRVVYIAQGASFITITRELQQAGVLRSEPVFRRMLLWLEQARNIRAGEYRIPARMAMYDLAQFLLKTGKPILHPVQFVEGLTSWQMVEQLRANPLLTGDIIDIPPEGSLLPETYFVERDTPRAALLARMRAAMEDTVADIWARRPEDFILRSPAELVIMASLVEKEAGMEDERALISEVFLARLQRRMRLQSDPTVIYGLVGGKGQLGRPILLSELQTYTPYNTYRNYGLPPTAIANPGKASLESVIVPANQSYLYFVADGKGGHWFAKTLRDHNRNVTKWRRLQRQQAARAKSLAE